MSYIKGKLLTGFIILRDAIVFGLLMIAIYAFMVGFFTEII